MGRPAAGSAFQLRCARSTWLWKSATPAKGRRVPRKVAESWMPTQVEIEEHNITHLPYRFWCIHCFFGRGEQAGHLRQEQRLENAIPEVHMGGCFMPRKVDDVQLLFVARDQGTRMTVSFLVQKKGAVNDHVIKRLLQLPREQGRGPIAHGAVSEKLAQERGEAQSILEHSPAAAWEVGQANVFVGERHLAG